MEINIYRNRIIPRLNLWNVPNSKMDPLSFFSLRCLQSWFLLAQARPVTNRSDWSLGLPRRAFKTVLIDWSLVSAEKKRVGGRIQPPLPPFPGSSLAENYLENNDIPPFLPSPPAPSPFVTNPKLIMFVDFFHNLLFISVCNLAL